MGAGASSGKALPSSKELALFEEMDKDGSGEIDIDELIEALKDFSKKVQNDWPPGARHHPARHYSPPSPTDPATTH